jgi:hypothetical protein
VPGHPRGALQEHPVRRAPVERVRVVPALGERAQHVADDRTPQLERGVVPRWPASVPAVHDRSLRVAPVRRVVPPPVAEVDPADERDVPIRGVPMLDDEQLLVMRAERRTRWSSRPRRRPR